LGNAGVTMFFTLSGFLITSLLLEEGSREGRYSIIAFYRRRALRLVPALVVCVAAALAIQLIIRQRIDSPEMIVGALTYTSNFLMMDGDPDHGPLAHTWSLAIEEQFYLLWPLLLAVLVRMHRRAAVAVMVLLAMLAVQWREALHDPLGGLGHAYLGLDTRGDALLWGCVLAFLLHRSVERGMPSSLALVAIASIVGVGWTSGSLRVALWTPLQMVVVLHVATHSQSRVLSARPLAWLGRRAYGIYLYHPLVLYVVRNVAPDLLWWALLPLVSAITTAVAAASFRWVETPFLTRRHRAYAEKGDTRRVRPV
jgi:peptidoglycan/LPS O-acetylase OafA/YrhL